jgi:hypothetical protein
VLVPQGPDEGRNLPLGSRPDLSERLGRAIVRARRQETRVAVLFLDLDRFKDINDSMGHAAGDRLLKAAATRLQATVSASDTVARLGGDFRITSGKWGTAICVTIPFSAEAPRSGRDEVIADGVADKIGG